jgi:predicted kinase
MIVLMAGLPGTGKTTISRELAARTGGVVLSKDDIRAALFASADIEYSTEQDDFVMGVMLDTAAYLLREDAGRRVFLDGRTFSRRYQIDQVLECSARLNQPWRILECVCSDSTAERRLQAHRDSAEHVAGNRDFALYLQVKARFEEITLPKTVIDTEQPPEASIDRALDALR